MYCKNCNSYNAENSRFCNNCGALLEAQASNAAGEHSSNEQPGMTGANETQYSAPPHNGENQYNAPSYGNGGYGSAPYSQPYGTLQDNEPFKNTNSIIAIILNVVIFNIIGLVLAILSLTNFNDYESALRQGNFQLAQSYKDKSKKYSKIAIILSIVIGAIGVLAIIGWIVFMAVIMFRDGGDIPMTDSYYEFEQFAAMAVLR